LPDEWKDLPRQLHEREQHQSYRSDPVPDDGHHKKKNGEQSKVSSFNSERKLSLGWLSGRQTVGSLLLYLLLAANAALVWSEFRFGDPAMSLNSRIAFGLGYALAPLVMASLSAGAITYYYTTTDARRFSIEP
jgi:hypothetical protein